MTYIIYIPVGKWKYKEGWRKRIIHSAFMTYSVTAKNSGFDAISPGGEVRTAVANSCSHIR